MFTAMSPRTFGGALPIAADLQFLMAHRIARDRCTDEPVPGPGKEGALEYITVQLPCGLGVGQVSRTAVVQQWLRVWMECKGGCCVGVFAGLVGLLRVTVEVVRGRMNRNAWAPLIVSRSGFLCRRAEHATQRPAIGPGIGLSTPNHAQSPYDWTRLRCRVSLRRR